MQERTIENPYGFIYITTNLVNGKRYIGQRKFATKRDKWQTYLGSGQNIKSAIKKHGKENFKRDIVDIAYSEEELNKKEIQYIKDYNAVESEDFYNIAEGGNSGNKLAGKTKEEINEIYIRKLAKLIKVKNVL